MGEDPVATRRAAQNLADPFAPAVEPEEPGLFEGAGGAFVEGIGAGFNQLASALGEAVVYPVAEPVAELIGPGAEDWLRRDRQAAFDRLRESRLDPNTVGAAGQVLYGVSSILTQVGIGALTGGAPLAAGAAASGQGFNQYQTLVDQGVDPQTAAEAGIVTGVTTGVGVALPPFVGNTLAKQVASAVGINVGVGVTDRAVTHQILDDNGYAEMADQYRWYDGQALITDALMGAALPGMSRATEYVSAKFGPAPDLTPVQRDAVDVVRSVVYSDRDLSPGLHQNPQSLNAHVDALNRVEEEVLANGADPMALDLTSTKDALALVPDKRHVDDAVGIGRAVFEADPEAAKVAAEARAIDERRYVSPPSEGRQVRQPNELQRDEFEAAARAVGLTDLQIDALAPRAEIDSVTGWHNLQGKGFLVRRVVQDAIDAAKETGQRAFYVSLDLQNLGGLNAFYKEVADLSNAEYRAIMDIVRQELDRVGGRVYMRTGGDELSTVVSGATPEVIQSSLDRAFDRIADYARERGYGDIKHAKGKPVKGVNVYGGFQEIAPGMKPGAVINAADAAMGLKKQAAIDKAQAELEKQNGTGAVAGAPGAGADGGQAGRGRDDGAQAEVRGTATGTGRAGEGGEDAPRPALDVTDNSTVARAGNIGSIEEAAARQALDAMPDMRILTEDGREVAARDYLDELDREIADAQADASLHDVAVACFLLNGDT